MRTTTAWPLSVFSTGIRWLVRHPAPVLGIALFWTVLMIVAPWAQIKAGVPDEFPLTSVVNLVFMLPVEFYALPMFMTFVDAKSRQHPANLPQEWKSNFEARWRSAVAARVVLYLGTSFGIALFIIPGLIIFFFLAWMPVYILLRGGNLIHAARWSVQLMLREWPRIMVAALPLFVIYVFLILGLSHATATWGLGTDLWQRFHHPIYWLSYVLSAIINIWFSLSILALFQHVEPSPISAPEDGESAEEK